MPNKSSDLIGLVQYTPEEIEQIQRETRQYREQLEGVLRILRKDDAKSYKKALKSLVPDDRDSWEELVVGESYQPTAEGLREYINDQLWPLAITMQKEAIHHEAIKAQIIGEGLQPAHLENLCRYETHLDRKFERTLAMLIKLKEMRGKG